MVSDFKDIKHTPLRIYNRCVVMFNLLEDKGLVASEQYIQQFSQEEQKEMLDMLNEVKRRGPEEVKREIMRNMPLQEDHILHEHVYENTDNPSGGQLHEGNKKEAVMYNDS